MFYDSKHVSFTLTAMPAANPHRRCAGVRTRFSGLNHGADSPSDTLPRPGRRRLACLLAGALLISAAAPLMAQGGAGMERKVKAAFLYKFLGYAEFPPSAFADAAAPVVIGVVEAEGLAAELARIVAGRTVQSRPIAVKQFKEGEVPAGVHLLFVGGSDGARVRSVLKAAQPAPMLVVTEAENGLRQGSVINFKIVDERVRFDISLEAADKNSVKLSSRLLTVANHVHKGAP